MLMTSCTVVECKKWNGNAPATEALFQMFRVAEEREKSIRGSLSGHTLSP